MITSFNVFYLVIAFKSTQNQLYILTLFIYFFSLVITPLTTLTVLSYLGYVVKTKLTKRTSKKVTHNSEWDRIQLRSMSSDTDIRLIDYTIIDPVTGLVLPEISYINTCGTKSTNDIIDHFDLSCWYVKKKYVSFSIFGVVSVLDQNLHYTRL